MKLFCNRNLLLLILKDCFTLPRETNLIFYEKKTFFRRTGIENLKKERNLTHFPLSFFFSVRRCDYLIFNSKIFVGKC